MRLDEVVVARSQRQLAVLGMSTKLWANACTDWRVRSPDDLRRFLTWVHLDLQKGL
jgi:hypothetical protein